MVHLLPAFDENSQNALPPWVSEGTRLSGVVLAYLCPLVGGACEHQRIAAHRLIVAHRLIAAHRRRSVVFISETAYGSQVEMFQ